MTDPVFFEPSRRFTAADIATLTGAQLRTPEHAAAEILMLAPAVEGGRGALIFIDGRRNSGLMRDVEASAILCSDDVADQVPAGMAVLVSRHPHQDFAAIGRLLYPAAVRPGPLTGETGISSAAHIHAEAVVEPGAIVEATAVIGPNAAVGAGTIVAPGAVIGAGCRIGRDCYIGPGASLQNTLLGNGVIVHGGARLGQDGFGYVAGRTGPEKVPQIGRVVVQDNVEIGANTTVDRGALSDTVVGEATKIDNLVQIAHNVRIGRACLIAGLCGISGSVTLGDGVMLGGSVGLADHVSVGDGAAIAARAGVMHDVPAGERWAGAPARPMKEFFREVAAVRRLTDTKTKRS